MANRLCDSKNQASEIMGRVTSNTCPYVLGIWGPNTGHMNILRHSQCANT